MTSVQLGIWHAGSSMGRVVEGWGRKMENSRKEIIFDAATAETLD